MFDCPTCNGNFTDGVRCSKCSASYCYSCANISEINYRKLGSARQATVLCTSCKVNHSQTSKPPASSAISPSTATLDLVLQELRNGINGINTRLEQLPAIVLEIKTIKENMHQFEVSITSLKNEVAGNSEKLTEVTKRVESLENQPAAASDYPLLKSEITKLSNELALKDQLLRLNNVEIKGIPMKRNENLFDLVCKLGGHLGLPIEKTDINFVSRAQSTAQPKPIIVGFLIRYTKENFVASARSHKPYLTAEDIGFVGNNNRIYINDHLSKENKQLLTKTKKAASEKNYSYVWVQNGKILTRKNDTSPIIAVKSESDLSRLK